ncbi:MAG TPA: amino acid adenylation domain-containing protein, partial [Thermoanaerobaculia bacterium]|nr:amino acid adenylation domain-containing protein [Thermoanaerobaculia bacterium]
LGGDPSGSELAARVRGRALAAYAHQDLPFARLVAELRPQRSFAHGPLYQVALTVQNAPEAVLEIPGLRLEAVPAASAAPAPTFVSLEVIESAAAASGALYYRRDLLDPPTAARLAGHWQTLLAGLVADPAARLAQLPLLSAAESAQLLVEWNDTAWAACGPRRQPVAVHESFAAQAARTPAAPALIGESRRLTYGELERESNRLARYLRARGAGSETLVAICLERGVEVVIAMLAVLKTGGAYLPLDADDPDQRLSQLLATSRAALLVTRAARAGRLASPSSSPRAVCLDAESERIAGQSAAPLAAAVALEQLAYLIFTSGSTGRPKGVLISHQALSSFVAAAAAWSGFGPGDRMLQFASLAFDASVFEIYTCLVTGAAVVLRGALPSFAELARLCLEREATALFLPTAYWHGLTAGLRPGAPVLPRSVRLIVVGGEAMRADRLARWRQRVAPPQRTWNVYGPTETTVLAAAREVTGLELADGAWRQLPIGRPLGHCRHLVLDFELQPVPIGVAGELCIGGPGLARGYLDDPERTAASFVPDPFGGEPGGRLYRSGDRVRRLADGDLIFLGRADRQVKVRGYRVEPAEVEATLTSHPAVAEAAVLSVPDGEGAGQRLLAYVTAAAGATGEAHGAAADALAGELRAYLARRLPGYLQPAACIVLASLPRTKGGKVDRRGLAARPAPASAAAAPVLPFGDAVQELLALLWSELLALDGVAAGDDFFALGGHSLLATQLVSRVRDCFGVEIPLAVVFETPTVAGMADAVCAAWRGDAAAAGPLVAGQRPAAIPLSYSQHRFWLLDQLSPGDPVQNLPRVWRLAGRLDRAALAAGLDELARRHEVLRTRFPGGDDGTPVQEVMPPAALPPPLPLVDLSRLAATVRQGELTRWARRTARLPFDLAAGPPWRAHLVRLAGDEHVLLWTLHHIASDGWSRGVELAELAALYQAFAARRPSPLPSLPVQYADYAIWQRQWLAGAPLAALLAYWQTRLSGPRPELRLRGRRPLPDRGVAAGAIAAVRLPRELSGAVKALGRGEGATLFIVLLAAWQSLLYLSSGQPDQRTGTPTAGRSRSETEGLVGCFINTLVLRTVLAASLTFRQAVQQVREVAVGAYAHQDLPFELLPGAGAAGGAAPLFGSWFVLQNAPLPVTAVAGLEIEALTLAGGESRFDLALNLGDGDAGVQGQIEYRTALYHRATIGELATDFVHLLEQATADPALTLAALGERLAAARGERQARVASRLARGPRSPGAGAGAGRRGRPGSPGDGGG